MTLQLAIPCVDNCTGSFWDSKGPVEATFGHIA